MGLLLAGVVAAQGPVPVPKPTADDLPKAEMTLVDSSGQPVVDEVTPGRMIVITTEQSVHDAVEGSLRWRIEGTSQIHVYPDHTSVVLTSELTPGVIRVQLIAAKGGRSDDQVILIRCGRGPQPPPAPDVVPEPDQTRVTGLRVLIVYESEAKLTAEQLNILNSTQLMALLNAKCVKDAAGRAEWRRWDKTSIDKTGLLKESAVWQDLWKSVSPKLTSLPQLVIATDRAATVHKLPATEVEVVEFVQKINTGGK